LRIAVALMLAPCQSRTGSRTHPHASSTERARGFCEPDPPRRLRPSCLVPGRRGPTRGRAAGARRRALVRSPVAEELPARIPARARGRGLPGAGGGRLRHRGAAGGLGRFPARLRTVLRVRRARLRAPALPARSRRRGRPRRDTSPRLRLELPPAGRRRRRTPASRAQRPGRACRVRQLPRAGVGGDQRTRQRAHGLHELGGPVAAAGGRAWRRHLCRVPGHAGARPGAPAGAAGRHARRAPVSRLLGLAGDRETARARGAAVPGVVVRGAHRQRAAPGTWPRRRAGGCRVDHPRRHDAHAPGASADHLLGAVLGRAEPGRTAAGGAQPRIAGRAAAPVGRKIGAAAVHRPVQLRRQHARPRAQRGDPSRARSRHSCATPCAR
jgi:hypothetical protein